jgi:hypothetical protein
MKMARNILQISIKDSDVELNILADFLRCGSIAARAINALKAFYFSLAVAANPASSEEDIRKALHYCLSLLKGHMCFLMDKHYRDHGIRIDPDEFGTVMINPVVKEYAESDRLASGVFSSAIADTSEINDRLNAHGVDRRYVADLSAEDRDVVGINTGGGRVKGYRIALDEIDCLNSVDSEVVPPSEDLTWEDDDDLSDEEYAAKELARLGSGIVSIK